MANDEDLNSLKQGVKVWNARRHKEIMEGDYPFRRPDLRKADLVGADFSFANFSDVDLNEANLAGARLIRTSLTGADLTQASLVGADLREATLLSARLIGARLMDANLFGCTLWKADLNHAELGETVLASVDLSEARGLSACMHWSSSILDHRTLQKSGQLPLNFLRGCGLTDWEIESTKLYDRNLTHAETIDIVYEIARMRGDNPIQFYSCFISYSSKDDGFARRLHTDLQNQGIRCWFAPEDMRIGDRLRTRIDEVIRLHEKLVLVVSENSIDSDWVEKEVETAFETERETRSIVLFPVRLDAAVMESKTGWAADIRRRRHIGDFSGWKDHESYQKALKRLLRDLTIERSGATSSAPCPPSG